MLLEGGFFRFGNLGNNAAVAPGAIGRQPNGGRFGAVDDDDYEETTKGLPPDDTPTKTTKDEPLYIFYENIAAMNNDDGGSTRYNYSSSSNHNSSSSPISIFDNSMLSDSVARRSLLRGNPIDYNYQLWDPDADNYDPNNIDPNFPFGRPTPQPKSDVLNASVRLPKIPPL